MAGKFFVNYKCQCCGHHEIGITTDDGGYVALKPGMIVQIMEDNRKSDGAENMDTE